MIYDNLIVDEKLIKLFNNYINKNLPHSFIFHGNKGVGKFGHAIEFSNLLLSKNEQQENTKNKIKQNLHENINYILPLPRNKTIGKNDSALKALSKGDIENIYNNIQLKLKNPYHDIIIEKANTILINSIRDIKKKINLSNYNNQYNIYIILEAEKLCYPKSESANSLLKILEEPNDNNLFILITSNISKMLDTLTSRCTKIFFPNLKNDHIKAFLKNELNIDEENSNFISNICNGDITFAIELSNNFEEKKDHIKLLIDLIINYDIKKWNNFVSKLKNKKKFKILLKLFLIFLIDINNYKIESIKDKIRFNTYLDDIKKFNKKYSTEAISKCIDITNKTNQNISKNLFMPLLATTFYIEIFQTLNKKII